MERWQWARPGAAPRAAEAALSARMLLPFVFFLLGAVSGFAAYRLASARRRGRPQSPALVRIATVLAYAWFALSALLLAWAIWRLAGPASP